MFSRCYNNNIYITKKSHLYISYESRIELFKLDPLELRRLRYDLALIYQISNKHTAVDRNYILFLSTHNNPRSNGYTLSYPSYSPYIYYNMNIPIDIEL